MADLLASFKAALGDRYAVEREIGSGGIGHHVAAAVSIACNEQLSAHSW